MSLNLNSLEEEKLRLAFESIDNNTPTIINNNQYENSVFDRMFIIDNAKIEDYLYQTDFNRIAQHIIFKGTQKILKFYIPINIYCNEDRLEERKVNSLLTPINTAKSSSSSKTRNFNYTLYNGFPETESTIDDVYDKLKTCEERGLQNRPIIEVYVNGYKIPDRYILLTIVNGTTDVYFESKYLNEDEENEIVFIIKKYSNTYKYNGLLIEDGSSELSNYLFHDDNRYDVYRNGKYQIRNKDYQIVNNKMSFLKSSRSLDIVEIKENDQFSFTTDYTTDNFTGIFYTEGLTNFNEVPLETFNKTISKNIIDLYVDGQRYFTNKIDDLSGTYFVIIDDFATNPKSIFFRVNLDLSGENYNKVDYLDAYNKATNFFNTQISIDSLLGQDTSIRTPEYFTLRNLNESYSPTYLGNKVKNPIELINTKKEYFLAMLKNYVLMNSYYFKHIVKFFKDEVESYEFIYNEENKEEYLREDNSLELSKSNYVKFDKPKVVFQLALEDKDKLHFIEKLFVNKKFLIPNQDYVTFTNSKGMFFIYINESLIDGESKVECFIERSDYKTVQNFKFIYDNKPSSKVQIFDLSTVGATKEYIDDLIVAYKKPDKKAFSILDFSKYELTIVKVEGVEKIRFRLLEEIEEGTIFSIYNNLFLNRTIYTLDDVDNTIMEESNIVNLADIFTEINDNPFIKREKSKNNIEIYLNENRLFENVNYDIIIPSDNNRIEEPIMIIKVPVKNGDKLSFINKETVENVIETKTKISSKYGLVYLPSVKYPFSTDYIDTYVNGVKVDPENIDFVANNVIKIRNVKSLNSIILISHIDMSDTLIDEFYKLSLLNKDSFEEYIKGLLEEGTLDDTWENVKDSEEDLKPISPDLDNEDETVDVPFNKLVEGWFLGIVEKRLDCNEEIPEHDIARNVFFDFFIDDVIQIDANHKLIYVAPISDDVIEYDDVSMEFDANRHYYSIDDIANLFAKEEIFNANENIDGDLDNFETSNMNKYIYIENKITLDANRLNLDNQTNLDANTDLENNENVIIFNANI